MTNPKIIILQQKKDELTEVLDTYSKWSEVEIWIAGIAPLIRKEFPEYLEDFERYCKTYTFAWYHPSSKSNYRRFKHDT